MDALEAAISRYEEKARKHYALENRDLKMAKDERQRLLDESLRHLRAERMNLESINDVQTQLAVYREAGMKAVSGTAKESDNAIDMMENESHHPTLLLEKFMRAEYAPKPSKYHTAHHILPGKGQYHQIEIARARLRMHLQGVRINDPANGVYLVTVDKNAPHWSMPKSRGHLKYHTADYERHVASKIGNLRGQDLIKRELQLIGRIIQQNEPKTAISRMAQSNTAGKGHVK